MENYRASYGILLDMVGAPNASFYFEGYSMSFNPGLVNYIWDIASEIGYDYHFKKERGHTITDDHVYVTQLRNFPCIDIIQQVMEDRFDKNGDYINHSFGSYWHTHNDNMSNIDKGTLKAVGQTLLEVIYRES